VLLVGPHDRQDQVADAYAVLYALVGHEAEALAERGGQRRPQPSPRCGPSAPTRAVNGRRRGPEDPITPGGVVPSGTG
jgi:hypothetical protein